MKFKKGVLLCSWGFVSVGVYIGGRGGGYFLFKIMSVFFRGGLFPRPIQLFQDSFY